MLQVRLLGQFKVEVDRVPIEIPSRPAQSLLAYLILNIGTAQRRERLAGLFWPDSAEANARSNLRHALWRIRKALGTDPQTGHDFIISDDLTIAFNPQTDYRLDVTGIEQIDEETSTEMLIEVISLYQGELLPGFYEEWVVLERERLQAGFEYGMQLLLDRLVREQRWPEVLAWGESWIALGQTPEPAYRALMTAHNELGDHSSMVAVYQRCGETLQQELGVEPSEQTQALFQRLRHGQTPPSPTDPRQTDFSRQAPSAPDKLAVRPPPFLEQEKEIADGESSVFVARERELTQLDGFLTKAFAGRGQVVFVVGGAGRGKTSLVNRFAHQAQTAYPDLIVATGTCNVYTGAGSPYLPFREILGMLTGDIEARWVAGTISRDHALRLWGLLPHSVQALVERGPDLIDTFLPGQALVSRVEAYTSTGTDWLDHLEELTTRQAAFSGGHGPNQSRIFEEYTAVLKALANRQPLLLILDDLHWADLSSINLLCHLGRRLGESRILIVGVYRPEDVAQGWEGGPHPLTGILSEFKSRFGDIWVDLSQAGQAERRAFVDALLDTEPNRLGRAFRYELAQQTEGHPLFTVELLREMQARGDLCQDEQSWWIEGRHLDWDSLPARVEGVIEKRMDRLEPDLRETLEVASVEGEEFTAEVVAQVRGVDERELVRQLSGQLTKQHRLVSAQGIQRLGPDGQRLSLYRFRHNLFQKYLFHSLDDVERCYLHEEVGHALEQLYGSQTEEVAVQLARHFQAAGIPEKAVDYLHQAGERAVRLSANEEAVTHFANALSLLETLPATPEHIEKELTLQIALGVPLIATKGYAAPEVEKTYTRARELCQQAGGGETPHLFPALRGLWNCFNERAELQTAHELGKQLLDLAQSTQDPALLVEAHRALGTTLFFLGEFSAARGLLEQGIALYDPQQHHSLAFRYGADPGVVCRLYSALTLWNLGYADQALRRTDEALNLARELSHPHSLAFALVFATFVHVYRREGQVAQERAEATITLSTEQGFPAWLAVGTLLQGWALAEQGQGKEGIPQIREGLAAWRATGAELGRLWFLALLAEGYGKAGQIEAGLSALTEALAAVDRNEGCFYEAEIYRLKGELLLKADALPGKGGGMKDKMSSESCFQRAIEVARAQKAKSVELRATVSLARLWCSQGSPDKIEMTRQQLTEIYNWFSEGFDTIDLQEAKSMLEELSKA